MGCQGAEGAAAPISAVLTPPSQVPNLEVKAEVRDVEEWSPATGWRQHVLGPWRGWDYGRNNVRHFSL